MIALTCARCRKALQVQDQQAGKQVQCPHCGQVLAVPTPATMALPTQGNSQPRPETRPADLPEPHSSQEATVKGVSPGASPQETFPPAAAIPEADATQGLYDFLAPAQGPGEIGRLGPYRILKKLGEGGMGFVFQAEDPQLKRSVALKVMKPAVAAAPSAAERFFREGQAAAAIKHDHIVTIYQVGKEGETPFLAMEFLEGEALDTRLRREKKLPLAEVLRIGREIADGLAAANQRGLIHRDIKPGNLWLEGAQGRVKILDFGLARAAREASPLTQSGCIVGTPAYMAPEQAQGLHVDARCDLFSLGAVLYHLATGELPFKGKGVMAKLLALTQDTPQHPGEINPGLPPALSDLIMKLLAKAPAQRPPSARAVGDALREIEEEQTALVTLHFPTPGSRREKSARFSRGKLVAGAVAAALAGMLLLGAFFLFRTRPGTLIVTVPEPGVQVVIDGKQRLVLGAQKTGRLELPAGSHNLVVKRDKQTVFNRPFVVKSGEDVLIEASWAIRKAPERPVDEAWLARVAALKPQEQVQAVAAKLQGLNPGFDGKVRSTVEGGVLTGLEFLTDQVADISPLQALRGLRTLKCNGTMDGPRPRGKLADLWPLKEMNLRKLDIHATKVADLALLEGMELEELNCNDTEVADLGPLKKANLTRLYCAGTAVSDLFVLKGMNLTELNCKGSQVSDLTILKGMPLQKLHCDFSAKRDEKVLASIQTLEKINEKTVSEFWKEEKAKKVAFQIWLEKIRGLAPAAQVNEIGEKLKEFNPRFDGIIKYEIQGVEVTKLEFLTDKVTDISPVRALVGLKTLKCEGSPGISKWNDPGRGRLADLAPLKEMKLTELYCGWNQVSDLSPLENINLEGLYCQCTPLGDLRPIKGMKLKALWCSNTKVIDLSPLKDMKLERLDLYKTGVSDISVLKRMKLTFLNLAFTRISDLFPLRDMMLTHLECDQTQVTDLSPLRGIPLKFLKCNFNPKRDAEILRSIKTLEKINGKPAQEFWKKVDAGQAGRKP